MINIYVIWDTTRKKWWKPKGIGYTGRLIEAGTYSKDYAKKICDAPYTGEKMYLKSNITQSETLRQRIYETTGA